MRSESLGEHGLLDLYGIDATLAQDEEGIRRLLLEAASQVGATVLQAHFHHFGPGQGVTGVLMLSESHMSIHTWPERGYAAIDVFMCGGHEIKRATRFLQKALAAREVVFRLISRGEVTKQLAP